jgi:hypothetical protein
VKFGGFGKPHLPATTLANVLLFCVLQRFCQRIQIGVDAAFQPDGITLDIAAKCWVKVPVIVVRKVRFLIEVLPREPEVELERAERGRVLVRDVHAKRFSLVPLPDRRSSRISDQSWRVEVIDVTISAISSYRLLL